MCTKKCNKFERSLKEVLETFEKKVDLLDNKIKCYMHETNPLGEMLNSIEMLGYDTDGIRPESISYPEKNSIDSTSHIQKNNIQFNNSKDSAIITITRMDSGRYEVVSYLTNKETLKKNKNLSKVKRKSPKL